MISKGHIISFSVIVLLYAGVAIWKWLPPSVENPQHSASTSLSTDESMETRFWDHYNRATHFRSQQLYREASKEYSEALKLKNNHKDALYYAGSMHLMLKEYRETKTYWDQLLKVEPNAPRTHLQLGTLHFCMDSDNMYLNLDEADEYISHAWQLNREETGAPLLLSKISLLKGDFSKSKRILDDLLATDASSIEALFLAGYIQWKNNNHEAAQKKLAEAQREYQMRSKKILQGEGNTETGARAMLAGDRFCDGFEHSINKILSSGKLNDMKQTYKALSDSLEHWNTTLDIR